MVFHLISDMRACLSSTFWIMTGNIPFCLLVFRIVLFPSISISISSAHEPRRQGSRGYRRPRFLLFFFFSSLCNFLLHPLSLRQPLPSIFSWPTSLRARSLNFRRRVKWTGALFPYSALLLPRPPTSSRRLLLSLVSPSLLAPLVLAPAIIAPHIVALSLLSISTAPSSFTVVLFLPYSRSISILHFEVPSSALSTSSYHPNSALYTQSILSCVPGSLVVSHSISSQSSSNLRTSFPQLNCYQRVSQNVSCS